MNNLDIKETYSTTSDGTGLKYLVREPMVKSTKSKAIILLHGVGSNEKDLFGLASQLPQDFYVISPRGQFTLGTDKYAWYNVDFSTGRPVYNKEQEISSRKIITAFIEQVKLTYNLDEIYLGGFSQGAIMSYSVGLTQPQQVKGIVALSGRLLEEIRPLLTNDKDLQSLKVFVAHGIHDETLPIHYAREAKNFLENFQLQLCYHEYVMGHQINTKLLNDLNTWLTK